jgi:cytochrome c oxidase subunit 3
MNTKIETIKTRFQEKNQEQSGRFGINPVVFTVWLLIIASIMLFAAFSSAYIVHRADGIRNEAWLQFELPIWFWVSAIISVVSSVFMQLAYNAAKKDNVTLIPSLMVFALLAGIGFAFSQYMGWSNMVEKGLYFSNQYPEEISASFVYAISYVHLAHIILGMVLLSITFAKSLKLSIHKKNLVFINISTTYWHFLGILWIYIVLFLYFAR